MQKKNDLYIPTSLIETPNIVAAFTTRVYDVSSEAVTQKTPVAQKMADDIGFSLKDAIMMEQVHGNRIAKVNTSDKGSTIWGVDGLVAREKGIYLIIRTADCAPILFVDTRQIILGVAHSGWMGTLEKLPLMMAQKFIGEYASAPQDMRIIIGPTIGACCYNVPKDRIDKFIDVFGDKTEYWEHRDNAYYLNLPAIIIGQIASAGFPRETIEGGDICNSTHDDEFYSRRGDYNRYGSSKGTIWAVLGFKE